MRQRRAGTGRQIGPFRILPKASIREDGEPVTPDARGRAYPGGAERPPLVESMYGDDREEKVIVRGR
jgi:hypothetical protein